MDRSQIVIILVIVLFIASGALVPYFNKQTDIDEKDFVPNDYYKGYNADGTLDYKRIYNDQHGDAYKGASMCTVKDVSISKGTPYKPNGKYGLLWFWPVESADRKVITSGEDLGQGRYAFQVPPGTELISIADSTLVSKTQFPISMYPHTEYSNGVHLGYIIKLPEEKKAFRITYQSMEKWWVCANKDKADEYEDDKDYQPKYYVGTTFTDDKQFYTGTVVGYSGQTGVPLNKRGEGKSYVVIKLESADLNEENKIDSDWRHTSIEELYEE